MPQASRFGGASRFEGKKERRGKERGKKREKRRKKRRGKKKEKRKEKGDVKEKKGEEEGEEEKKNFRLCRVAGGWGAWYKFSNQALVPISTSNLISFKMFKKWA